MTKPDASDRFISAILGETLQGATLRMLAIAALVAGLLALWLSMF